MTSLYNDNLNVAVNDDFNVVVVVVDNGNNGYDENDADSDDDDFNVVVNGNDMNEYEFLF